MKRLLLFSIVLFAIWNNAVAYTFSAAAPSGQTLYFNIVDGNAEVTYQRYDSPRYNDLRGSLIIPSSVTYGSTTYSVTSIGAAAFYGCDSLTSVTIPNTVTSIGVNAFYNCSGLTGTLTIPSSITFIGDYAFYNCSRLTGTLTIPNIVTEIGEYAFYNCSGLTGTLNIPDSVSSIGNKAFYYCSGLTSVTIPPAVTYIGEDAFCYCSNMTSVNFNAVNCRFGNHRSSLFSGCPSLTSLNIGENVQHIHNYAFWGCVSLTSLTIPNSVTDIGTEAFCNCTSLISIAVMSGNTVFDSRDNCNAIIKTASNSLILGCMNTTIPSSVTAISSRAFYNCVGLSGALDIPSLVTSIGDEAFSGCTGLTGTLTLPISATNIGEEAFYRCTGLTGVLSIPNSVTVIGNNAFRNCTGLTSVIISNSVTVIGNGVFRDCTGLTSVTIPNSVISIEKYAFQNCTRLTSATIPNTVSSIGTEAFEYCTNMLSLTIGSSVSNIGGSAFYGCTALQEIHSKASVPPSLSGNNVFDFNVVSAIPVYIPCGRTPYYAAADGWSRFTNFIEEGENSFSAVSADNQMGVVQILTRPTCTNPQAIVYASPNSGHRFDHWSDGSTANPYSLNVYNDLELVAYFSPNGGGDQPSDNAPSIACVGVDMTNHNVVRWEPRQGVSVVRYNIYREGLGGYSQVGYVNTTNATEYSWVDDNSNTATQAYSYKISEVSANGTESDLSLPHTTMHLQISQGQGTTWNLSWTPYVGFNYSGYRIFRGTSSASISLLTELSSSATTYSDNNAPSGNVYYQIEVVASSAKSITASSRSNIATSVQNQQFTVIVLSDNTSMGTVSGGGTFAQGATTTITATPLSGYTFTQWSDGSTQAQRTITVTGNATYTAYFTAGGSEPQQYLITVVSNNPERGTVTGGGLYDAGAMITITAEPFAGYEFVQWHDGNTNDFRTITVTADATYTAYFRTATEGINDVEAADNIKIYTRGNRIVIDFSGQQTAGSRL